MSNSSLECLIMNQTEIYCFINMFRIVVLPDGAVFHLRVEINAHLLWFCIIIRYAIGAYNLAQLCHPVGSKTKTNCDTLVQVFPNLKSAT